MTTHARQTVAFGPRLVATATGRLSAGLLVRPSPAIERATPLIGEPGAVYERAREQHEVLRTTLEYFGVKTTAIEPTGDDPYETSVADAAVVFEDGAALMRLSSLARRAEADRIETHFASLDVPLAGHIAAPGLLDGTDVLLAGKTAFVGAGSRGNDLGRNGFAALARAHGYRVVEVRLAPGVRALQTVAGALSSDTLVVEAEKLDVDAFAGFRTIALETGEGQGAGVLVLDERHVIADLRFGSAIGTIRRAGITVEAIDLYEFAKIGLTPSMLMVPLRRD